MTTGVELFPQTLPALTVAGNPRSQAGPVAAIPFDALAAGLQLQEIILLTGVAGTNTITATTSPVAALTANQYYWLTPAITNTSSVTLSRDGLSAKSIHQAGAVLQGGELAVGVPSLLFYDGTQYNIVGITTAATFIAKAIDSGTTGSLSLKTNNGTLGLQLLDATGPTTNLGIQSGTGNANIYLQGATNSGLFIITKGTGSFNFLTGAINDSGGSPALQLQVLHTASSTRNITITGSNGGNPTISTTAGALALGNGQLQFPATQNPSSDPNTLDDYEEGTWVPSVGGSATYTTQTGTYTKIGRLVFIKALILINAIGTGSQITISGLPFPCDASGSEVTARTQAAASTIVSIVGEVNNSASTITLQSRTAASVTDTTNAIFTSGTSVVIAGCYQTT